MKKQLNAAALLVLSASLAACSSGSGGGGTPTNPTPVVTADKAKLEELKKPLIEKALKVGFSAAEADAYATKNVGLKDEVAEANLKSEIGAKANRDRALYIADIDGNAVVNQINAYQSSAYQSGTKVNFKEPQKVYSTGYYHEASSNTSKNATVRIDGKNVTQTRVGNELVLIQPYSVVYGSLLSEASVGNKAIVKPEDKYYFRVNEVAGYAVTDVSLPKEGKAVYSASTTHGMVDPSRAGLQGDHALQVGNFKYTVDFGGKTGYGSMSLNGYLGPNQGGLGAYNNGAYHEVALQQGTLEKIKIDNVETYGVKGSVATSARFGDDRKNYTSANGNYVVGLFGPNAEELAGRVTINAPSAQVTNGTQTGRKDQVEIGVAGVRGSIQK